MKHKIGNTNDLRYRFLLYINSRYGDIAIMAKSNFFEKISCSTQESQVQETYNEMFKSVFKINTVDCKCQCDGYIDTRFDDTDISMLIEYKYDIRMKDKIERARVIAQCVGYLRKFEESGMALPKLVFIGDINECMIIHTNDLIKFLDLDCVNWDIAPCNLCQENNLIMPIVKSINPWVYDVDSNFKFDDIVNKIISLCKGINQQVHITEKNIEKIFNNFCKRVLKNSNKISANDLVAVFIGAMLDQEHYYKHPTKKNILIANGNTIAINGDEYDAFMNQHSTDYSPKEKRIFASISDRLIEDTNRRNKGEFYTPTIWVDYAHKLITEQFGSRWKEGFVVYDCCCGTKNLTRDYRFKELYCSTLEQAELDISKNYNKEATSFQFDFLNDPLDDLKVKAPGLLDAFENNKPIMFFINPPYVKPNGANGNTSQSSNVCKEMHNIDGFKQSELICQFLWRILNIKRTYHLTNCCIACFTKPTWLCGESTSRFRKLFFQHFKFTNGIMFNAGEFSNVSSLWGITFNLWRPGECNNQNEFEHILTRSTIDGEIEEIGTKVLYNRDGINYIPCSKLISQGVKQYNANKLAFKFDIKTNTIKAQYKKVPDDYLSLHIGLHGDYVQNNNACYIKSGIDNEAIDTIGSNAITKQNFLSACMIYAMRNVIQTNWIIDKDSYIVDPNREYPESFITDCLVYSLFSNYAVSTHHEQGSLKNEMFWMSKKSILDLAEQYNNADCYEDCITSEDSFAYNKLTERADTLTDMVIKVLAAGRDLVINSFQYRELFNESHPEYQINNWDCGFYQLKALLKEFMPDDLKTFRTLHKQLGDKIRHQVYELGFLK